VKRFVVDERVIRIRSRSLPMSYLRRQEVGNNSIPAPSRLPQHDAEKQFMSATFRLLGLFIAIFSNYRSAPSANAQSFVRHFAIARGKSLKRAICSSRLNLISSSARIYDRKTFISTSKVQVIAPSAPIDSRRKFFSSIASPSFTPRCCYQVMSEANEFKLGSVELLNLRGRKKLSSFKLTSQKPQIGARHKGRRKGIRRNPGFHLFLTLMNAETPARTQISNVPLSVPSSSISLVRTLLDFLSLLKART
jgi:hypothetical protein